MPAEHISTKAGTIPNIFAAAADKTEEAPSLQDTTIMSGAPAPAPDLSLAGGPWTPEECISALEIFREQVIRPSIPEWNAQRSILRPAMIETFVRQLITDPTQWYNKVPQYLRTGTNPAEKMRFLESICEMVERIDTRATPRGSDLRADHSQTSEDAHYRRADPATIARPDRDRFAEEGYAETLRAMIAHVIEVEAPIFEDLLVTRIARAHGLLRSGNLITRRIVRLLPSDVLRVDEGDRKVIWPKSKTPGSVHVYRKDHTGERGHENIPVEELAAIAAPFTRLQLSDEAILRKVAEEFKLDRLREATRTRFQVALQIARQRVFGA